SRGCMASCDVPGGGCFQSSSIFSLASFHSGTVVRQKLKIAACWAGERASRGVARAKRAAAGRRSALASPAGGTLDAKAAGLVVLIVIAVPAAVVLRQLEFQLRSARKLNRLFEHKYGLARHIAAAGADIDAPRGVVLAIDRVRDRPGHPLLVLLIVENRHQLF